MKLRAAIGLLAVCAIGLALPDPAQAGFGRRGSAHSSPRSSSSSSGSRSPSHSQSSFSSGGFGRSSRADRYDRPSRSVREDRYRGGGGWGSGHSHRRYPRSWGYPVWGYGFGYVPSYAPPPPMIVDGAPPPRMNYGSDEPMVAGALAGDLTVGSPGPLLGVQLSVEGERLGLLLGYTAAFAPIAGTGESDMLHLLLAHITYAFLATERVRLRAELGGHFAAAPLVAFAAPGAGLSAAVGLAGPLGLEARAFGNIWPYTQLDARAGLTLSLGEVGLGAGIRGLYLNDNGVLGAVNAGDTSDSFWGPYVTLAFAL